MNTNSQNLVDITLIKKEIDNDSHMMVFLTTTFIDKLNEYEAVMEVSINKEKWDDIYSAAHLIKPSLMMFGLKEFYQIHIEILENSMNLKDIDMIEKWFNQQKEMLLTIHMELKEIVANYEH